MSIFRRLRNETLKTHIGELCFHIFIMVVQKHKISFECARTYTTLGVCQLMERVLLQSINY